MGRGTEIRMKILDGDGYGENTLHCPIDNPTQ